MAAKLKGKKMTAKKKATKSKSVTLLPSLPKFKRIQAIVGVMVVAGIGAYYILTSLASGPNAVSTAADTIVLEYVAQHGHGVDISALPEFQPEPAILYGNGLLLCGVGHFHGADANPLHSAMLSSTQLSSLINSVSNSGVFKAPAVTTVGDFMPAGAEESVVVNYITGAKKTAFFAGTKPAGLQQAEDIITSKCATVATPYRPEGVVLNTRKSAQADTALSNVDGTGLPLAATTEPDTQELHGLQSQLALNKFGGHSKANITSDGQTYDATIQPILPTAKGISFKQAPGTALAGSYAPLRMYWFYPYELGSADPYYNTIYPAVSSSVRSFYAAQIYGKQASAVNAGLVHGQHTSAWYHACQSGQSCYSDGDLNAYNNVRAEMRARGYEPNNQAVDVLSQIPSSRGSNWCYGYGGPSGSVTNSLSSSSAAYSTGFAITFGYGPSRPCEAGTLRYWNTAHEYGHVLGLNHTCGETGSIMDSCNIAAYNASWPSYFHVNSSQKTDLNLHSLGLNQRIQGRVYNGSTGAGYAASIYTCTGLGTITANANGYFDARLGTNAGFCLRVTAGAPAGYTLTTNNNSEHAGAGT